MQFQQSPMQQSQNVHQLMSQMMNGGPQLVPQQQPAPPLSQPMTGMALLDSMFKQAKVGTSQLKPMAVTVC